jgi:nitroreductase
MQFLLSRRSRPAKTLKGPGPDRATIETLLTAAARSPDHGKLEPWRFVVLEGAALARLAGLAETRAQVIAPDKVEKIAAMFANAPCIVAVVSTPEDSEKIPEVEQTLSAGAVCLALCNAAQASGWGANWLSGVMAYDPEFLSEGLELAPRHWVAGYIVIGTEGPVPPERPRPDLSRITRWVDA